MEILGIIFLVLIAIVVLGAIGMFLVSLPDINRYRRIRNM